MLPGQSQQIPAMGMPAGYASMMQWEDPNGMPQQVFMMTAPTGQQIALTSVYPMPQNAMMPPGQQRFMPPPPQYSVRMAPNFRGSTARSNDLQMSDGQHKKMEKDLKQQQQFMEQQRRLQGMSNLGSVKVDPNKLIESIMGKSETAHKAQTTRLPAVPPARASHGFDPPGEDVFGDFLSSSTVNPAQGDIHPSAPPAPPAGVSGYLGPRQLPLQLGKDALDANGSSAQSLGGEIPSANKALEAPKKKTDLSLMMMQCSDLSAPKEAKRFEKKKTVNEIQVTKTVSVTYNESKAARHWDSSAESLSELFVLPASLASQPTAAFEAFEGTVGSPSVSNEFRLPPWITGTIPIHSLYQQVLDAVTRDGVILTELVYPLLLQSGLPREALGYIWELCNRQTPGQLAREELLLILAMICIAQNGLDYSSLAILSMCPQPPIPNLGHSLSSPTPQQTTSFPGTALEAYSVDGTAAAVSSSALSGTSSYSSQVVEPAFSSQGTIPNPSAAPSIPSIPGENWHEPGRVQNSGYATHRVAESLSVNHFSGHTPTASVSVANQSAADDDEFEQFQTAPLPVHSEYLSHSSVNAVTGPLSISPHLPKPHVSHRGEFELMQMNDDKYAALRDLSSLSSTESETTVAAIPFENPVASTAADITIPGGTSDSDFTDFASFSDASASDVPMSVVSTFSYNSDNSMQSQSTSNSNFAVKNCDLDGFSTFGSQMKSDADSSNSYSAVKSLINDPSVFTTMPLGGLSNSHVTGLSGNDVGDLKAFDDRTSIRDEDRGWAAFSSSLDGYMSAQTNQKCSSSEGRRSTEPPQGTSIDSEVPNREAEEWAEFESVSSLRIDRALGGKQYPSPSDGYAFPERSKPIMETEHDSKTKRDSKTKLDTTANKVQSFFGQVNSNRGAPVGVGISPLDFHPPELPEEDDNFDDFAMYPSYPKDGNSAAGISSLSMHYLEDEHFDCVSEEKNASFAVNGKTSSAVLGMTQSISSNSLEFTGWKLQSGATVKEPDVLSTSSLELRQYKVTDFRDESPQRDGDSQSVSSLDFPPIESEQKSTADEQSVTSLELKPTSPELDPIPSGENGTSNKISPLTAEIRNSGFNLKESVQGHPVDLKELLEQGSLGRFGDRYRELRNEVQDSDRHAYEWQRCLEICNGFLSEGNSIFSSLSSSSVLHEILSTDEGATYLKGLVEIYFVARRIEEEMRFVSVSNSRLASILKDVNVEWNDIAAICAGNPMTPDSSSLNFQSSFLKAGDYEARRKACGVCLLNVDIKTSDVSGGVSGSRSLSYGGRQYHTPCANFWINCVSKTLPSLTIPELL